jgi:shikimate kinase
VSANGPVLVLVGPPGSGKSTVGRMAADHLGVGFRDFDDDMAAEHGKEAGELVVDFGRERFQELEHELLVRVLPQHNGVLALGGGTPTAPGVSDLLKPYHVVFLDVDLDQLLKREGLITLHPWLLPNPRAHLRQLLTDRRPIYTAVADATVPTSGRDPGEVLKDVLASLPLR